MIPPYKPLTLASLRAAMPEGADPKQVEEIWELRQPCITLVREILVIPGVQERLAATAAPGVPLPADVQKILDSDSFPEYDDSYLFGEPHMPSDLSWPLDAQGNDLMFIGQINLAHLPPTEQSALLPETGILYFFGSESGLMDGEPDDSCAVLYSPKTDGLAVPDDEFGTIFDYNICRLHPIADYSLPSLAHYDYDEYDEPVAAGVDLLLTLRNTYASKYAGRKSDESFPQHQMFGHPSDPQGTEFGDIDHILLQIHSDAFIGLSWLDAGTVYFVIDDESLRDHDWSQVRMYVSSA